MLIKTCANPSGQCKWGGVGGEINGGAWSQEGGIERLGGGQGVGAKGTWDGVWK